ncbi:uncharacterized protein [Centruroides vittatus]|uniref:uncharacterized protein n=1 Tax=Centruroides vittatus TaxID=120091 RepID=UPI003510212F
MPRDTHLTDFEKGQIVALGSTGLSLQAIANSIKCSKKIVQHYLSNPANYGPKCKSGHPSKLTLVLHNIIVQSRMRSALKPEHNLISLGKIWPLSGIRNLGLADILRPGEFVHL